MGVVLRRYMLLVLWFCVFVFAKRFASLYMCVFVSYLVLNRCVVVSSFHDVLVSLCLRVSLISCF